MTDYNTCMDEVAQYQARIQDEWERARQRDAVRKVVREGIEIMKEEDRLYLECLISVTVEDLAR